MSQPPNQISAHPQMAATNDGHFVVFAIQNGCKQIIDLACLILDNQTRNRQAIRGHEAQN